MGGIGTVWKEIQLNRQRSLAIPATPGPWRPETAGESVSETFPEHPAGEAVNNGIHGTVDEGARVSAKPQDIDDIGAAWTAEFGEQL